MNNDDKKNKFLKIFKKLNERVRKEKLKVLKKIYKVLDKSTIINNLILDTEKVEIRFKYDNVNYLCFLEESDVFNSFLIYITPTHDIKNMYFIETLFNDKEALKVFENGIKQNFMAFKIYQEVNSVSANKKINRGDLIEYPHETEEAFLNFLFELDIERYNLEKNKLEVVFDRKKNRYKIIYDFGNKSVLVFINHKIIPIFKSKTFMFGDRERLLRKINKNEL